MPGQNRSQTESHVHLSERGNAGRVKESTSGVFEEKQGGHCGWWKGSDVKPVIHVPPSFSFFISSSLLNPRL